MRNNYSISKPTLSNLYIILKTAQMLFLPSLVFPSVPLHLVPTAPKGRNKSFLLSNITDTMIFLLQQMLQDSNSLYLPLPTETVAYMDSWKSIVQVLHPPSYSFSSSSLLANLSLFFPRNFLHVSLKRKCHIFESPNICPTQYLTWSKHFIHFIWFLRKYVIQILELNCRPFKMYLPCL